MIKSIEALRKYTEDNHRFAKTRIGQERAVAALKHLASIEDYYEQVQSFIRRYEAQAEALDTIQERTIAVMSQELLPEKFKSHTQWMRTMDAFFKPRVNE